MKTRDEAYSVHVDKILEDFNFGEVSKTLRSLSAKKKHDSAELFVEREEATRYVAIAARASYLG